MLCLFRHCLALLVLHEICAVPVIAQPGPISLVVESPAEKRHREALQEPTTVDFEDTPLTEALQFLAERHQITIWLDKTSLADEGLAEDLPVSLQVDGVRLRSALALMLEQVGLRALLEDDVIKVTVNHGCHGRSYSRVYAVGDLASTKDDMESLVSALLVGLGGIVREFPDDIDKPGIAGVPSAGALVIRTYDWQHEEIEDLLRAIRLAQQSRDSTRAGDVSPLKERAAEPENPSGK